MWGEMSLALDQGGINYPIHMNYEVLYMIDEQNEYVVLFPLDFAHQISCHWNKGFIRVMYFLFELLILLHLLYNLYRNN